MKNIKLTIEYDGTNYSGWQRQLNGLTIQQTIEEALEKLTGEKVNIIGAGRTDSGVHARGQVANFRTNSSIPPDRFSFALNSVLPKDIRVVDSEETDPDFHARYRAKGKKYKYAVITGPYGTAIGHRYYYHVPYHLNASRMSAAAEALVGTHDFSAFQSAGSSVTNTVRTVYSTFIEPKPPYLYFTIQGDGFLYNMVRIIMGTLIEIGTNKKSPEDMMRILKSGDRKKAGPTAPPQGLFLEEVYY